MKNGFIKEVKNTLVNVFKKKAKKIDGKVLLKPIDQIKIESMPIRPVKRITNKTRPIFPTQIEAKKRRKRKTLIRIQKNSRKINRAA